jgi:glucan phosphoethanolaminetransferase (alkaline phosphatase superfamily)
MEAYMQLLLVHIDPWSVVSGEYFALLLVKAVPRSFRNISSSWQNRLSVVCSFFLNLLSVLFYLTDKKIVERVDTKANAFISRTEPVVATRSFYVEAAGN